MDRPQRAAASKASTAWGKAGPQEIKLEGGVYENHKVEVSHGEQAFLHTQACSCVLSRHF